MCKNSHADLEKLLFCCIVNQKILEEENEGEGEDAGYKVWYTWQIIQTVLRRAEATMFCPNSQMGKTEETLQLVNPSPQRRRSTVQDQTEQDQGTPAQAGSVMNIDIFWNDSPDYWLTLPGQTSITDTPTW